MVAETQIVDNVPQVTNNHVDKGNKSVGSNIRNNCRGSISPQVVAETQIVDNVPQVINNQVDKGKAVIEFIDPIQVELEGKRFESPRIQLDSSRFLNVSDGQDFDSPQDHPNSVVARDLNVISGKFWSGGLDDLVDIPIQQTSNLAPKYLKDNPATENELVLSMSKKEEIEEAKSSVSKF